MMKSGKLAPLLRAGRVFRFIVFCSLLVPVIPAIGATESSAQSDADSDELLQLETCIQTARIRRTYIVDDRTIIFYMNQKKIYVNNLPHRCAGLLSAGAFSYRTSISELCNVDTIKVLWSTGSRIKFGPTCGLGKFRPVTEEEAAMIRNKEAELPPKESKPAGDTDKKDSEAEEPKTQDSETSQSDQSEDDD